MKTVTGKILLLIRMLLPSSRLRLLLGAWIIASGLISCVSDKSGKTDSTDSIRNPKDSVSDETCYRTAVKDSSAKSEQNPKAVNPVPPTTVVRDTEYMECYVKVRVEPDTVE